MQLLLWLLAPLLRRWYPCDHVWTLMSVPPSCVLCGQNASKDSNDPRSTR